MLKIDPEFAAFRNRARSRRRRERGLRVGGGAAALVLLAGLIWGVAALWSGDPAPPGPRPSVPAAAGTDPASTGPATADPATTVAAAEGSDGVAAGDGDEQMVQVESQFDIAPVVVADTFTNIRGDPMILRTETAEAASAQPRRLEGPSTLEPTRVGAPSPERLVMVQEGLYVRDRRLMTALPTSREDFALFQAQRSRALRGQPAPVPDAGLGQPLPDAAPAGDPAAAVDPVPAGASPDPIPAGAAATGSSTAFLRESSLRPVLWQDLLFQIRVETDLKTLLVDNGWSAGEAERLAAQAAAAGLGDGKPLQPGTIVALRYRPGDAGNRLLQMSLYGPGGYLGSVADTGNGLAPGSDPWISVDLNVATGLGDDAVDMPGAAQFRLLDALYSAAIRKNVPTELVGEMIAMMSQVYDLDAVATPGDVLTMIYAADPDLRGPLAGRVLFAGVNGPSGAKPCYVVPDPAAQGYRCHAPGARIAAAPTGGAPVLDAPVAGVVRTRFGQDGAKAVTWDAAAGTPVSAAAAGRVTAIGPAPAGGLSVTLDGGGGVSTRYEGLGPLAKGVSEGVQLAGGAPLGAVAAPKGGGDAGLTFYLMLDGRPSDPMRALAGGTQVLASNAVESLIGRIIKVESAGNAQAKNPLSTATGLGQFIDGTWMRMMGTYRPDIVGAMSRSDVLALRFDPGLSTEMVRHLAQENEAYLRARGHAITSGRLYLAHFLGPEGAHRVLSAPAEMPVVQVVGQGVVGANPFLAGYTNAQLVAWAERKMTGSAVIAATPAPAAPAPVSPEVERFVRAMDALLADAGGSGNGAGPDAGKAAPGKDAAPPDEPAKG
ncbi:peptidoglycan DD-metalloendopeptidase family protein [Paracoccus pacificus]|uniref:Peptidoglycan DD-metalloendopeptidase family protein n=1 Tax=Paracoccus pacificus TaxID=1463598 RepID=A0ABW4R6H1_9RHOB